MCGVNSVISLVLTGLNECSGSGYYAKCCSNCRISANKLVGFKTKLAIKFFNSELNRLSKKFPLEADTFEAECNKNIKFVLLISIRFQSTIPPFSYESPQAGENNWERQHCCTAKIWD